jgi:hypothetical protein
MLPFTDQLYEIISGTKTMTTRLDAKLFYYMAIINRVMEQKDTIMDMWWQNPRTQKPECYKIGRVTVWGVARAQGAHFYQDDAVRDGFETLKEYKQTLARLNGMPWYEVDRKIWTQIQWKKDGWLEGPHLPPEDSRLWDTTPELRHFKMEG